MKILISHKKTKKINALSNCMSIIIMISLVSHGTVVKLKIPKALIQESSLSLIITIMILTNRYFI